MEVKNNYSPAFSGIYIKTSKMNDIQQNLSRKISDMLDYSDEYVRMSDDVDVYMLPGKNKKSIVVKFMDHFSDMLFRNGRSEVVTKIDNNPNKLANGVDDIRKNLADIESGKIKTPKYDAQRFLDSSTDFAKMEERPYDEIYREAELMENEVGKEGSFSIALNSYQDLKKLTRPNEF